MIVMILVMVCKAFISPLQHWVPHTPVHWRSAAEPGNLDPILKRNLLLDDVAIILISGEIPVQGIFQNYIFFKVLVKVNKLPDAVLVQGPLPCHLEKGMKHYQTASPNLSLTF
jgi:hypothetical protein